jgi:Helix-turn-helix domain
VSAEGATTEVLAALLWGFHNAASGACFASYEAIATKAECCRDTVCVAIKALELPGVLAWVNRIVRERVREPDLFGQWTWRWRVIRTSNAYTFHDPKPGAVAPVSSKAENPSGTAYQGFLDSKTPPAGDQDAWDSTLQRSLRSLGEAIAGREPAAVT